MKEIIASLDINLHPTRVVPGLNPDELPLTQDIEDSFEYDSSQEGDEDGEHEADKGTRRKRKRMPTIKEQQEDESPTFKKPLKAIVKAVPPKIKISDTTKVKRGMLGGSFKIRLEKKSTHREEVHQPPATAEIKASTFSSALKRLNSQ